MDKETIAAASAKISYGGAGGAVFFGLTANEFAALGGLAIGVIGLIINIIFKWLAHRELIAHHKNIEGKK